MSKLGVHLIRVNATVYLNSFKESYLGYPLTDISLSVFRDTSDVEVRASRHFVMLIEIRVDLIRVSPGHICKGMPNIQHPCQICICVGTC